MGSQIGEVDITVRPKMTCRTKPMHNWEMDSRVFYYFGLDHQLPNTNIVRSLKENILSFTFKTGSSNMVIHSGGQQACRFDNIDGENIVTINDLWDNKSLLWGNYMKLIPTTNEIKGQVTLVVEK